MIKKLIIFALGCLFIAIVGMTVFGFKFQDSLPSFEKTWTFSKNDLSNLSINSDYNAQINFIKSIDGTNSIQVHGSLNKNSIENTKAAMITNHELQLHLTSEHTFNFLDINIFSNTQYITVKLTDDSMLNEMKIQMHASNLYLNNVQANRIDVFTSSGNVNINKLLANQLHLDAHSGNINMDHISANTTVSLNSGNLSLTNFSGLGKIEDHSGNIKVTQIGTKSLDILNHSGNVTVIPSSAFKGLYDLRTQSGTIHAPDTKSQTTDVIKVRTHSGNIAINHP